MSLECRKAVIVKEGKRAPLQGTCRTLPCARDCMKNPLWEEKGSTH